LRRRIRDIINNLLRILSVRRIGHSIRKHFLSCLNSRCDIDLVDIVLLYHVEIVGRAHVEVVNYVNGICNCDYSDSRI
ncbi:hypothetical protein PFISCL1PPCAC_18769, partial [Pristionchus fissidentatus]